jgi:hypothetical protein
MKALGYNVRTTAMGNFAVTADDEGKEVDPGDYVSFPTYFSLWKRDFNNLKVSRPADDICKDCYVFANRHRHLAHHHTTTTTTSRRHDGDDVRSDSDSGRSSDDDDDADDVADLGVGRTINVDLNLAEAASNGADEERELAVFRSYSQELI